MRSCEFFLSWERHSLGQCDVIAVADIPYNGGRRWFCAEHYDIVAAHYKKMYLDYGDTWPALAEVANL